jgi:hypothetical protein
VIPNNFKMSSDDPGSERAIADLLEKLEEFKVGATLPRPAVTPAGPAELEDWIALCTEKPIEPVAELPICDCHHHFFDMNDLPVEAQQGFSSNPAFEPTFGVRNALFRALHATEGSPEAKPAYLAAQLLADMEGNNVVSSVFEECGFRLDFSKITTNPLEMQVGEVAAVAEIADKHKGATTKLCRAINANAFLTAGAAIEPVLAQMCAFPIMRGVRDSAAACEFPEIFSPGHEWGNPYDMGGRNLLGLNYLQAFDHPQFREG